MICASHSLPLSRTPQSVGSTGLALWVYATGCAWGGWVRVCLWALVCPPAF